VESGAIICLNLTIDQDGSDMKKRIKIVYDDITKQNVDAIVNAANNTLLGGGGVDGAIHQVAGPDLLKECRTLNGCETGEAKITKGYRLRAKFVIHTIGPIWYGGNNNEAELLAACYRNCLNLAVENNIKTIAFPSISTGVYGYPIEQAAKIAISETLRFLESNKTFQMINLVCFSEVALEEYSKVLKDLNGYN